MKKITFYQLIGRIKKGTQPKQIRYGWDTYYWEEEHGAYISYFHGLINVFVAKEDLEDCVECEEEPRPKVTKKRLKKIPSVVE